MNDEEEYTDMLESTSWEEHQKDIDRHKRLECFVANLLRKIPFDELHRMAVDAMVTPGRMCQYAENPSVAEVVFWLRDYEIGRPLPEGYIFTERISCDDEEDDDDT